MALEDIYASRYPNALVPMSHPMIYPFQHTPYHPQIDASSSSGEQLHHDGKSCSKKSGAGAKRSTQGGLHFQQPNGQQFGQRKRGLRCFSRPILLNNVALTFLLIAGLGLLAALSMGAFFALKPRFTKTTTTTVTTIRDGPVGTSANQSSAAFIGSQGKSEKPELAKLTLPTDKSSKQLNLETVLNENKVTDDDTSHRLSGGSREQKTEHKKVTTRPKFITYSTPTAKPDSSRIPIAQQEQQIVHQQNSVNKLSTSNPQFHKFPGRRNEENPSANQAAKLSTTDTGSDPKPQPQPTSTIRPQTGISDQTHHKVLQDFGKVVGIAYREGYLYVPSYETGKISVLATPDLKTIREYRCDECTIYDIAVLANGDMVLARGRQQLLTKLDATGRIVANVTLDFATKGLTVSTGGSSQSAVEELYVIPRSHDAIHIFDTELNHQKSVAIPNKSGGDCNFVAVNSTRALFVSCQDAVYVFDREGALFYLLEPPRGISYAVGIATDESDNIMVVRRGQGVLDIFNSNGEFVEAVGENTETLWSDIAAGDGYLYAVDYIDAKIKVFRYL